MADQETKQKILNFNIGVLGHVDSGKTSLSKALSTTASTAAFDKNPQSKDRGITLDLGFSSFLVDLPKKLTSQVSELNYDVSELQFTLVDCPGHASLIKTIIGGAQIIDMMMLVIDITKGMQTQTAECLVIGEILCEKMVVVLNKVDMVEEKQRKTVIEKMQKRMLKTLENTRFANSPVVAVAAKTGGAESDSSESIGIQNLIDCLKEHAYVPNRKTTGPFMFSVDHCFSIRGQGTVLTGTVLSGSVSINDTIEIPALKETKKVKSMQMFRQPIKTIVQGDRSGICVTQFDPKRLERGVVCTPGYLVYLYGAVVRVNKIPYFKGSCINKTKFHITVGHETVMAKLQFFGPPPTYDADKYQECLNTDLEYIFKLGLNDNASVVDSKSSSFLQYVILEFDKPITCMKDSLLIGSRLDTDINLNTCRLAFYGRIEVPFLSKDYAKTYLPFLKIYKTKQKDGIVERMMDDYTVIVKSLFKKETNMKLFENMKVTLSTGEQGVIEGTFGLSGKVKIRVSNGLSDSTKERLATTKRGREKKMEDLSLNETSEPVKIFLDFKKFIYDESHKMIQT
ncbi:selenocysteine-specific elongation factor-like [Hydractinia symbiolongicarpus]|uniref:selenocysteine-specific elongation factor-like n=1 Tax=Hydractinia symbiolongicarpus TaxID=13093 RepID=UPI002550727B|nr:selenocysteine-specific elongation factor-like [Hydractinia symbiolongicarpus]